MNVFEKNIIALYQDEGQIWLENLPGFLNDIENRLKIKLDSPFPDLSFHYTASATTQHDEHIVFKCGLPNKALTTEIAALQHYAGQGAVHLIDANADEGWLLLERCQPGLRLTSIKSDDEATIIAVDVMKKLWKPIDTNAPFPTIADWLKKLTPTDIIPNHLIDFAQQISKDLLASPGKSVLLHGDLHHENILSSQRAPWLAIDPKGVIGEREYEVGALMRNPLSMVLTKSVLNRRLDLLSEHTGFDHQRLLYWSAIQAVLSAYWCIEDNTADIKNFIDIAELLYSLHDI